MNAYVYSIDADYRRMLQLELAPLFEQVILSDSATLPAPGTVSVLNIDGMEEGLLDRFLRSDSRLFLISKKEFSEELKSRAVCYARPFLMRELVAELATAVIEDRRLRRRQHEPTPIRPAGAFLDYDSASDRFLLNELPLALSEKEKKLLALLYENRGKVVTTDTIFQKIGDRSSPESNSVAVYISFLRKKLQKDDTPLVIIRTVRGIGYMLI